MGEMKDLLVPAFRYKAQVVSVYDGDTVHVLINVLNESRELGLYLTMLQTLQMKAKLRLDGLNAPELSDAGGAASRDYLRGLLPAGLQVEMEVSKAPLDKYGRYVAVIYLPDGQNVNELMISTGHAERREYLPRELI